MNRSRLARSRSSSLAGGAAAAAAEAAAAEEALVESPPFVLDPDPSARSARSLSSSCVRRLTSFCRDSMFPTVFSFTTAVFLINMARCANLSVDSVSP